MQSNEVNMGQQDGGTDGLRMGVSGLGGWVVVGIGGERGFGLFQSITHLSLQRLPILSHSFFSFVFNVNIFLK